MTRTEQLTEATTKRDEARTRLDGMTVWNTAKRDAAEDLEFWSNKVAFVTNWIVREGE